MARFDITPKQETLYIAVVLLSALLFEVLPYVEELLRGLRAKRTLPAE